MPKITPHAGHVQSQVWYAVQAAPTNREAWWHLGRLRLDLGESRTAIGPLKHVLKGWPTHAANPQAWRAMVQGAMAAGQKEGASEALSCWLESLSGKPDAAVNLGAGGAMPASAMEAALQVRATDCHRVLSHAVPNCNRSVATSV